MSGASTAAASAILAMHARYEAAATAVEAVDTANLAVEPRDTTGRAPAYSQAITALNAERDALRTAILYQMPETRPEALILQYHINIATDLYSPSNEPEHERYALAVAVDTLLDFLACEVGHDDLGKVLNATTKLMLRRRRLRTGKVEG